MEVLFMIVVILVLIVANIFAVPLGCWLGSKIWPIVDRRMK